MAVGMFQVGRLVATLGLNTTPFMSNLKGAQSALQSFSTGLMMTGRAMTRFITLPMAIAGGAAVAMQKDYEASMTKIIGLVGVARETVEGWSDAVKDIAVQTGRGPEELADALYFIASAGVRGEEALEALEMSAKGAAIGLGETKVIADLVTSAMNAYKSSNLSAAEAVDVVTAAVREGKAEADELASAMGMVLPIASAFKIRFDEVGAAFAGMTRTGTNARVAATQLKAIISAMASPSMQSADAMARFGTNAEEFRKIVEEQGLIRALLHLNEKVYANKAAFSEIFPNVRALMGVLDLLGDNLEDNIDIFESLRRSGGSLEKAFLEVANTTQQKLNVAGAALKVLAIDLGEVMSGPLVKALAGVIGRVERLTDWFGQFNDAQKMAILRMAGLVAVMGPAMVILSRLIQIAVVNPWVPIIAGAVLLITTIKTLTEVSRNADGAMKAMADVTELATNKIAEQRSKVKSSPILVLIVELV